MSPLQEGDKLPVEALEFTYIPIDVSDLSLINPLKCDVPTQLKLSQLLTKLSNNGDKKLLIIGIPLSFSPTCSEQHLPPYLENVAKLIDKQIGAVLVLTTDHPFIVNAWGKVLIKEYLKNSTTKETPEIIFANDGNFSLKNGLANEADGVVRNKRYAAIIDSSTKEVIYLGVEQKKGVEKSSIDSVLAKL